uniref:Uncharacterized protein n=1 Tax=Rhizophora mucronata TaxID=61149 RepID=A0A2P2PAM6_RHIMU
MNRWVIVTKGRGLVVGGRRYKQPLSLRYLALPQEHITHLELEYLTNDIML